MDWFIIVAVFLIVVGIVLGITSYMEASKTKKEWTKYIKAHISTPWRG